MQLKAFSIVAAILASIACGQSASGDEAVRKIAATAAAPSDAPLRASIARLATAWNAGDGERWASEYWPDGSLVNILGAVFPNAAAVAAITNKILAGPFKGSVFAADVRRVRFAGTDVAIVDADLSVTEFRGLPPGAVATKPGLLLTRFTSVFENRSGVWKIEASQNTAVTPQTAATSPG